MDGFTRSEAYLLVTLLIVFCAVLPVLALALAEGFSEEAKHPFREDIPDEWTST